MSLPTCCGLGASSSWRSVGSALSSRLNFAKCMPLSPPTVLPPRLAALTSTQRTMKASTAPQRWRRARRAPRLAAKMATIIIYIMGLVLGYPQAICPIVRVPSETALLSPTTPLLLHSVALPLRHCQLTTSSVVPRPPRQRQRQPSMGYARFIPGQKTKVFRFRVLPKMIFTKCQKRFSKSAVR